MNVAAHKQAGAAAAGAAPLVVRCGAFGDIVMLTTLIRLLHARYGRRIDVLGAGPWTHALLEPLPEVGTVWTVRSRNTPYLLCPSQWATVAWLRRRGRGPVYVCDTDAPTLRLLQRARLKDEDRVLRVREDDEHDGVPRLWPDRWVRLGQRDPVHRYPCAGDVVAGSFRLPRLVVDDGQIGDRFGGRLGYVHEAIADGDFERTESGRLPDRGIEALRPRRHLVESLQLGRPYAGAVGHRPQVGVARTLRRLWLLLWRGGLRRRGDGTRRQQGERDQPAHGHALAWGGFNPSISS